jgi:hypothetical protein
VLGERFLREQFVQSTKQIENLGRRYQVKLKFSYRISERSTAALDRAEGLASPLEYSAPVLTVREVVRKLAGDSQSVLVRASDGLLYWVKLMSGFDGPNALANEVLGNELARYLGISVPNWSPIEFSRDFLDSNPLCCPEPGTGLPKPLPGMYFATRALGHDKGEEVYEILPGTWLNRISNRDDFIGMLILDVWTNQVGNRKAVFVPSADRSLITAAFIENGQMFGGFWGCEGQRPGTALYPDRRVYANSDPKQACNRWLQKIKSIDEALLSRLVSFIPAEWIVPGYLEQVVLILQNRERFLEQLLEQELKLIDGAGDQGASHNMAGDTLPELSVGQILEGWKPENHFHERRRRNPGRRIDDSNFF